jgi:hypothetical protein
MGSGHVGQRLGATSEGESMMRRGLRAAALGAAMAAGLAGCEQKEKVLDVEGPGIDIEVERSTSDGSIDVQVDEKAD